MKIYSTTHFVRAFKKLTKQQAKQTEKAITLLMTNPEINSLHFRQLKGSAVYWIANINKGDRMILAKLEDDLFELLDIGEHDAIYRKWNRRK